MDELKQPVGYRLKAVDNALTEVIDQRLGGLGLNRFQWQILSVIQKENGRSVPREQVFEQVKLFLNEQPFAEQVTHLIDRGWVAETRSERDDDALSLTPEGTTVFSAAAAVQADVRHSVTKGLTSEEYAFLIRLLRKLANNLGVEGSSKQPNQ